MYDSHDLSVNDDLIDSIMHKIHQILINQQKATREGVKGYK